MLQESSLHAVISCTLWWSTLVLVHKIDARPLHSCKSCFDRWRGQSSDCATCKRPLKRDDWQAVKYGRKAAFQANPDAPRGDLVLEDVPFDLPIRLRTIDEATIEALGEIETVQKLSSKSDLIVKHVKHIRSSVL